ncbi:MAG: excinuclease ABC subunit UvrC [Micrococcaceae bacterium]
MAQQLKYRPTPGEIPTAPGVYRFFDRYGRVIYVGKAKNLRNRLNSYFSNVEKLHPRTYAMVTTAVEVTWTVVRTEREALQLEFTWIKEFDPRFNVMFRDDKSYPYLAMSLKEEVPRVFMTRDTKKKDVKYFGPYVKAWAIKETLDMLLKVFPVRTCTQGVYNRAVANNRPCLLGFIDKCSAPCVGNISIEEHKKLVQQFSRFMSGKGKDLIHEKEVAMLQASEELNFENAAKLRDQIQVLKAAFEKTAMVQPLDVDADIFALAEDDLEAAAQVFYVRGGRIRGQRGWVVEKTEDITTAGLYSQLLQQAYGSDSSQEIPPSIWLPELPEDADLLKSWLKTLRKGSVKFLIPQRGDKAHLLATVEENAKEVLRLHKNKRAGDITTRSAGLQELQDFLDLDESPLRIEGIDISHIQGTNVVASLVVIEDGITKKGEYRKFNITGDAARDDTAAMYDVVKRRFKNYLDNKENFKYPPNLLVVDGGKPQVAVAQQAIDELGLTEEITVVGLAKRLEEIWRANEDYPLILPRGSQALFMLQRLRDEAHRFAITFHRKKRAKSMVNSVFDELQGIGPTKQRALLKHFASVKKLKAASLEQLQEVHGIGKVQAENIYSHFNSEKETAMLIDMETGEVLDNE